MHYERPRLVRLAQATGSQQQSLLVPQRGRTLLHVKRSIAVLNKAWMDVAFSSLKDFGGVSSRDDSCGRDAESCSRPGDQVYTVARSTFQLRYAARLRDMAFFKIILDLDGSGASKDFLPKLGLGSAVFKASTYQDFSSGWLEPFYQ